MGNELKPPEVGGLPDAISRRLKSIGDGFSSASRHVRGSREAWRVYFQQLAILISAFIVTAAIIGSILGAISDGVSLQLLWAIDLSSSVDRIAAAVFSFLVFILAVTIGSHLLDESVTHQKELLSALRAKRIEDLTRFVESYADSPPDRNIHILAWRGYEEQSWLLSWRLFAYHPERSLALTVHPYEGAEAIDYLSGESNRYSQLALRKGVRANAPDYMILDIELFHAISNRELPKLPELDQLGLEPEVLESFPESILQVFENDKGTKALPLSYDVSAIAWPVSKNGEGFEQTCRTLLTPGGNTMSRLRIAAVDWYLPVMGLFALQINVHQPFRLSRQEFESLCQLMNRFVQDLERHNCTLAFLAPESLAIELIEGSLDCAIGGGSWAVSGKKRTASDGEAQVAWTTTENGALLWCESLVRFNDTDREPRLAMGDHTHSTILKHFTEVEFHQSIIDKRLCAGIPANREVLLADNAICIINGEKMSPATAIANLIQKKELKEREYPPLDSQADEVCLSDWTHFWDEWKESARF